MNQQLLEEGPLAHAVKTQFLATTCSHCFVEKESDKMKRCASCKYLRYCGAECQKADWPVHKLECKRYQLLNAKLDQLPEWVRRQSPNFPDDGLRLLLRIHAKVQKATKSETKLESNGRAWDDLMCHSEAIQRNPDSRAVFDKFVQLVVLFAPDLKLSRSELLKYYGRIKVNAFGILNGQLKAVGIGLYLSLCRLDHSCQPNARILFDGTKARVVPIESERFTEKELAQPYSSRIHHSYIENLATYDERAAILTRSYHFVCECRGCKDAAERNGGMVSLLCENMTIRGGCDGQAIPRADGSDEEPHVCLKCRQPSDNWQTGMMATEMAKKVLERLEMVNVEISQKYQIVTKSTSVVEGVLHDTNLYKMRLMRHAFEACVQLDLWADAVNYGRKVYTAMVAYHYPLDPWLANFGVNLAKAALNAHQTDSKIGNDEDGRRAMTTEERAECAWFAGELLRSAEPAMLHCWGAESEQYRTVKCLLHDNQKLFKNDD